MKQFIIGFTGTQQGMTAKQKDAVRNYFKGVLTHIQKYQEDIQVLAIHGDCIGADKDFDDIAKELGVERHIYPCLLEAKRAHTELNGSIPVHVAIEPLERNRLIVDASSGMLATPKTKTEELRSGTWATIRYAQKIKKLLLIIDP